MPLLICGERFLGVIRDKGEIVWTTTFSSERMRARVRKRVASGGTGTGGGDHLLGKRRRKREVKKAN